MALQRFKASSSCYSDSGDSPSSSSSDPGSSVDEPPLKKVKPSVAEIRNLSWNQLQSLELDSESTLAHFAMLISGIISTQVHQPMELKLTLLNEIETLEGPPMLHLTSSMENQLPGFMRL